MMFVAQTSGIQYFAIGLRLSIISTIFFSLSIIIPGTEKRRRNEISVVRLDSIYANDMSYRIELHDFIISMDSFIIEPATNQWLNGMPDESLFKFPVEKNSTI